MVKEILCSDRRREALLKMLSGPIMANEFRPVTTANMNDALRPMIAAGYVWKDGYYYRLTGIGRGVALQVKAMIDSEEVLQEQFFQAHDLGTLPDRFLMRIGALKGGGVVQPNGDAMKAQHNFMDHVATSKKICGASCFNVDGYEGMISTALVNGAEVELILSPEVLTTLDHKILESWQASGRFALHVRKVKAAFTVADDMLFLALFDPAGIIDALSEWVCQSEAAAEWGRELFRYYLGD